MNSGLYPGKASILAAELSPSPGNTLIRRNLQLSALSNGYGVSSVCSVGPRDVKTNEVKTLLLSSLCFRQWDHGRGVTNSLKHNRGSFMELLSPTPDRSAKQVRAMGVGVPRDIECYWKWESRREG